jgi:hypothetical protein
MGIHPMQIKNRGSQVTNEHDYQDITDTLIK